MLVTRRQQPLDLQIANSVELPLYRKAVQTGERRRTKTQADAAAKNEESLPEGALLSGCTSNSRRIGENSSQDLLLRPAVDKCITSI